MNKIKYKKLLVGLFATMSFASQLHASPDYVRAWAWAGNHSSTINEAYSASSFYSNSSGFRRTSERPFRVRYYGDTQITRTGTGSYRVLFENMTGTGGIAHVTAYGGNHRCKVAGWYSNGSGQNVNVRCFAPNGNLTNGRFTVLYYKDGPKGDYYSDAYLWANNPTASSYTPWATYQANSTDVSNTITRSATGKYRVKAPGMNINSSGSIGGTVYVTAYGTDSDYCKVNNWYFSGNDLYSNVSCYDNSGNPSDSRFTFSFMKGVTHGISVAEDQLRGAYVWANTSTNPASYYQYSYSQLPIERHDNGTGSYRLELPGMKSYYSSVASHVNVTAYGYDSNYCNVSSWGNSWVYDNGVRVGVQCFDANGNPSNSIFTMQYLTNEIILF
ncbi:hypothetical protein [Pleionea sediminis]|uniref:hypothetical protein n=1 Tax=Pleionea sediminis TaxID=2569479 RepID=UPI0011847D3C|nr:hypothetical protein [Pleionea sediminis]